MLFISAALLLLSAVNAEDFLRVPAKKRTLKNAYRKRIVQNFNRQAGADPLACTGGGVDWCVRFTPFDNGAYIGNITLPGNQSFNMILDTGSSDFWIYSTNATASNATATSPYAPGLLWSTPESGGNNTGIQSGIVYADGAFANYTWYTETVEAFGTNISVPNTFVGSSPFAISGYNSTDQLETLGGDYSGIVGLAFPALGSAYAQGVVPFLSNMVEAGIISAPRFGFYASSNQSSNDSISEVHFGGYDSSRYNGNLTFYDILPTFPAGYAASNTSSAGNVSGSYGFYALNVSSLTVGDNTTNLLAGTTTYIVDSGTSFLSIGSSAYNYLVNMFNGTVIANGTALAGIEGVSIPCSAVANAPNLTFTINGDSYVIPGSSWVQNDPTLSVTGSQCYLELYDQGTSSNDSFGILGDTFFRNYYVAIDQAAHQVGFAPHD